MAVSRSGKLYFTEEQLTQARTCSALEYAQSRRYDLVREGTTYHLREHDSMVFTQKGGWFWNSRGLRGRAIEFIRHYEGRTLPEAVLTLAGDSQAGMSKPAAPHGGALPQEEEKKLFELPERAPQFRQLFAYLCVARKLDFELVRELVHGRRIYEGVRRYTDKTTGEVRELHNAVFLALDAEGVPRSAFQRGLHDFGGRPYKRDVAGSDKEHFAFCVPGREGVLEVAVFEASIDAISHATLEKLDGGDYRRMDRIALGGVAAGPLLHYLEEHPDVKSIRLCLDNDTGGITATAALEAVLEQAGYDSVSVEVPPAGKDWNECLVRLNQGAASGQAGVGGA